MTPLLATKLLPEFEQVRLRDEQIRWIACPRFLPYVASEMGNALLSLLGGASVWLLIQQPELVKPGTGFTEFLWLFVLFGIGQGTYRILSRLLSYSKTVYAFSNSRVIMRTGSFGVSLKTIDYAKVLEMEVNTNVVDRIYHTGTIRFYSGLTKTDEDSTTKIYDSWPGLENAFSVFQQLQQVAASAQKPTS